MRTPRAEGGNHIDDNAYVFCSFLEMNMISKVGVAGYTARACDYCQVTADLRYGCPLSTAIPIPRGTTPY